MKDCATAPLFLELQLRQNAKQVYNTHRNIAKKIYIEVYNTHFVLIHIEVYNTHFVYKTNVILQYV